MKNPLFAMLAIALLAGIGFFEYRTPAPALAQSDPTIEEIMEGLDRDFSFGGKEEIKRNNLQNTNEVNREEIKIRENDARQTKNSSSEESSTQVSVQFQITDNAVGTGDSLTASITTGGTLVTGLDDATVTPTVSLPSGTSQTLSITCVAAISVACDYTVTILTSGIQFGSPVNSNTTSNPSLTVSSTDNFVLPIP